MQMWCRFSSSTVGKSLRNKVYCACLFSATELNTPTEVMPCGIGIARSASTDFERGHLLLFALGGKATTQEHDEHKNTVCLVFYLRDPSLSVLRSVTLFMCD